MENRKELDDALLETVAGGISDNDNYLNCIFSCPLCKQQHTFTLEFNLTYGYRVRTANACFDLNYLYEIEFIPNTKDGNFIDFQGSKTRFTVVSAHLSDGTVVPV